MKQIAMIIIMMAIIIALLKLFLTAPFIGLGVLVLSYIIGNITKQQRL